LTQKELSPALLVLSVVGVPGLGVETLVVLDVLEGLVHETAVAALVSVLGAAVDEVLLAERDELSSLAEVLTLEGAGRAERPARAAVTLVLDGRHRAQVPPILVGRQLDAVRRNEGGAAQRRSDGAAGATGAVEAVDERAELVAQQVGELVDLELERDVALLEAFVVSADLLHVVAEHLHAERLLHVGLVVLGVALLEAGPLARQVEALRQAHRQRQRQQQQLHSASLVGF
jgi:hypothetical protein